MHRLVRTSSAAALLVALSGLALAQGGSNDHAFVLSERVSSATSLDLGTPGPGPGDMFTGTGDLFDAHGAKVGTSTYTCITAADGVSQCSQVYAVPGGKIMTAGTTHPDYTSSPIFDARLAVVGGTGRYAGAAGELRLVQGTTSEATLTFHLAR